MMLASQALRATRAIKPSAGVIRGVAAPVATVSVRHASKEANAPFVKNIFQQNDLSVAKPKVEWRNKPNRTPDDLPTEYMVFGFLFLLVIGVRAFSILTGGDQPEERVWGPKKE